MATSDAAKEGVWMKQFMTDLGVVPSALDPITLFCDNTGAIALAKEPRFHKKTRHIKRRFNLIRDYVELEDVNICKVHTDLNVADPLTKPLPRQNMINTRTVWVFDLRSEERRVGKEC